MNEENVKQIVLNILQSWSFDINDINLERSFTIKFGKNAVRIDNLNAVTSASPRADILVTKNNRNLFIFELKADSVQIDDEDIKQGISYARLTESITPYVVITNGKDTRIFNAYNNEELKQHDENFTIKIKNFDYTLSTDIENLYYQATKYLIGMSSQNLSIFCKQQINSRMETLKGTNINDNEKYIPELFIERDAIIEYFQDFLKSDSTCFSIIGESGTGKTNVICDLALKYASDSYPNYLSYFYTCHELHNSISDNLKEDFNLHFTQQNTEEQIIKKLTEFSDKQTIIFFDAVDEKNNNDFPVEFNNFVRIAKDKGIKICFTCKDIEYERFLRNNGNPTFITKTIYSIDDSSISFSLNNFSEDEYKKIESRYKEKFNLLDVPKDIAYELKNGFMLRIYAEIHKNKRKFQAENIIEMMHEYLEQKLAKMYNSQDDKDIANNIFVETGKHIWEQSIGKDVNVFPIMYRMSDKILEKDLKTALNLRINERIPNELFEHKILQKNVYEDVFISFYYTRFRDYVIGFKYLKLDTLSEVEFSNLLPTLYSSNIGISIVQWYYQFANNNHKKIIEQFFISKVLIFINEYNYLIDKYFKEIKDIICPNIKEKIAIGIVKEPANPYYFFYPAQHNNDIVTFFDNYSSYNNAYQNIGGISAALNIDDECDMKATAFKRLIEDVLRTLEIPHNRGLGAYPKYYPKSFLNPKNNPIILNERAYSLFDNYSHLLGYKYQINSQESHFTYSRYKQGVFPIKIDDILDKIKKLRIKIFLDMPDNTDFSNTVFSLDTDGNVLEYDEEKINNFINTNKILPNINIEGIDELEKSLYLYKPFSDTLDAPLPKPDLIEKKPLEICESIEGKIVNRLGEDIIYDVYSKTQRNKYCKQWTYKMYNAYIAYIEEFFPSIKKYLYTYSNLPITINYKINDCNDNINNSLYCQFCYEILFKQDQTKLIKLAKVNSFSSEYKGWRIMPAYPETMEENAVRMISDEIKNIYKEIAVEEYIKLPDNHYIYQF